MTKGFFNKNGITIIKNPLDWVIQKKCVIFTNPHYRYWIENDFLNYKE